MLKEYYNEETRTLIIPHNYNEELNDLPVDTKIIIFEKEYDNIGYSKYDKK